jgi:hypothetical protein
MKAATLRRLLLVLAVTAPFIFTSCASTDSSENASVRPWNAPMGWENGLPSSMTEGR